MNLWGRMERWALILIGLVFFGCEDPSEIGAELNPNDDNFTTLFKEFTLPTSVVLSDSVTTHFPPELLVGIYDDPNFGKTEVISYTQLGGVELGGNFQLPISPDAVLDSAKLFLKLKFFVGDDFTQPQRLLIHSLKDTLFGGLITYKNTLRTPISKDPVAELEFNAIAGSDTLLILNINEEFGQELLTVASGFQITIPSSDFRSQNNEIPGLAFVPGNDNSYILGIDDNVPASLFEITAGEFSILRVYYHLENDVVNFARNFDFSFGNTAIQYMNVVNDRSSSVLSEISEPFTEYIPDNGLRYVQPINGINTKVDMSEVWDFIDSIDGFVVNIAEFEITEVRDSGGVDDFITTLENISLLFTGDNNKVVANGQLINTPGANGNINFVVLSDGAYNTQAISNPLRISYNPDEALFRGEISNYIQAVADSAIDRSDLMIFPLVANSANQNLGNIKAIDQLIFDADKIKIKLFYSTIQ